MSLREAIQTSCLSNQSLWFNRNYEIENPSFRSLKIFIRQTDKWHCQINANCQLTSQRVVVAITVCAAWCAWTVNGAGPDVVSGCACIASFEFRRGKFKRSEEKFLNRHGTSKFLIVIWYFSQQFDFIQATCCDVWNMLPTVGDVVSFM